MESLSLGAATKCGSGTRVQQGQAAPRAIAVQTLRARQAHPRFVPSSQALLGYTPPGVPSGTATGHLSDHSTATHGRPMKMMMTVDRPHRGFLARVRAACSRPAASLA